MYANCILASSMDKEMIDILANLAEEASPQGSQKATLSQSISLDQGRMAEDEKKSHTRAKEAHTAGVYPSFRSMKQLRVLLLPPGWDASLSQGYSQQYVARTHLDT